MEGYRWQSFNPPAAGYPPLPWSNWSLAHSFFAPILALTALVFSVRFTSHIIRHTFGSIAFKINFDWGNIKKMLNHKTGDITSKYVHANVNSLRPMFDEIAQGLMLNYDGSYLGDDGEPEHAYK